jgi:hypothetical protein
LSLVLRSRRGSLSGATTPLPHPLPSSSSMAEARVSPLRRIQTKPLARS